MWLLVIYSRNESRPRDPRSGWAAGSWGGVLERTWPGDPDFRVRSIKLRVKSLLGWAVMIRKIIYQIGEWKYISFSAVQFSHSVVSDSLRPHESQHARPPLSITNSRSSLRLTSIESVTPSSHLILCHPLLLGIIIVIPFS